VQKQLDEMKRKLDEQLAIANQLTREKSGLTARVKALEAEAANAAALRAENVLLRKQVTDLQTAAGPAANTNDLSRRLASAEMQIAALQSERDLLRLEKTALESRVKTLIAAANSKSAAPTTASRAEDAKLIEQLVAERDALQAKLTLALTELTKNRNAGSGAKADELAAQLAALRAKLNVYETKPAPYSAEELALFRQAPARLAATDQTPRKSSSIPKPPPGTGALVVEAQRHFARGEFNQAELKYQQVLAKDNKNVYTLANLAAIQIEADKLDDAEKNLKQALAVAPDDAYSMQMLGYLKFRQEKYDDALTYLSQAAQLSPDSAEVQNYLGVTLSHKGQREAAESALRKALILEPGYGSAHNNLAVIYATQTPPAIPLAQWHYQKALAAGHPKNAELERLFDKKTAAAPTPAPAP
jgi:Flp pilus assembly protein TadD